MLITWGQVVKVKVKARCSGLGQVLLGEQPLESEQLTISDYGMTEQGHCCNLYFPCEDIVLYRANCTNVKLGKL